MKTKSCGIDMVKRQVQKQFSDEISNMNNKFVNKVLKMLLAYS